MNTILETARKRYTAKHYDTSKSLSAAQLREIKELLRLAPSSVNSQPWHFILAATERSKARIAKSTTGSLAFNANKITEAPLTVVFCARQKLEAPFLDKITEQEDKDGRYPTPELKAQGDSGRKYFVGLHQKAGDVPIWTAKQVYLNIGAFLLGVAAMGLDATPIEGFDTAVLDKELGLEAKGLKALCLVSVGHRTANDGNATRPKSRLAEKELIEEI